MNRLKRGDRILIVVIALALVAGCAWLVATNLAETPQDGLVVVCQNKQGFYRADALDTDVTYTVESTGTEAGYNTVSIHDGEVDVIEADCSNQICVDHDPIAQAGEQIVCLPHGMVVEIVADECDATTLVS